MNESRRTYRKYTTQDISEPLLRTAGSGCRASNTGNMQLYSVVVTRDQANKEKLAPAHFNQPMITTAPVVLTFCADANRFVKWPNNAMPKRASTICKLLLRQRSMRAIRPEFL